MALTARELGVARSTVYRWLKKGRTAYGYLKWKGVERESTRPKNIDRALKPQEEDTQLNNWFQNYLLWHNTERPHFGIKLKIPLEVIQSVSNVLKH